MWAPLVLAAGLLAPCAGLPVTNFLAREREAPPLGAASAASLRLRTETAAYAKALGYLLDMAGVPMALRVPAARAAINREADRLEQVHGYTSGAEAFRREMPRLVPDEMMYYCEDPGQEEEEEEEEERAVASPRVMTRGTEILRDGQGGYTVRTTTCRDGDCARVTKAVDRTGAGHITPRAPPSTIARLMAGMSNIARQMEEELEGAGPALTGIIGGAPEPEPEEAAPRGAEEAEDAAGLDLIRAMEKIMGHGPLVPREVTSSTGGAGPRPRREEGPRHSSRAASLLPLTARHDPLDPFKELHDMLSDMMPGLGVDFPFGGAPSPEEPPAGPSEEPSEEPSTHDTLRDLIHRVFKEPSEGPSAGPSEEPPAEPSEEPSAEPSTHDTLRDLIHHVYEEPSEGPSAEPSEEPRAEPSEEPSAGDALGDLGDLLHRILEGIAADAPDELGEGSEHQQRSYTVTRIENGHGVQEIRTCEGGVCAVERRRFELPAGSEDDAPAE